MTDWPAFYLPLGEGEFDSTGATAGPWGPALQHGGPPAALLARALEREAEPVPQRLARLTVEILRPVPVAPLTIRVEVVRPGRRVSLLEASGSVGGIVCMRARAWKIEIPAQPGPPLDHPQAVPPVPAAGELVAWPGAYLGGYMSMIEWRPSSGSVGELGPADIWARPRLPLVEGEEMSPFQRATLVADSGSGVGLSVDLATVFAINVDLTVTMWRDLVGEWVFMSARTVAGEVGSGMAEAALGDARGIAGLGIQTMLMAVR